MRFNAAETPAKMGTFSQYTHPKMLERYACLAKELGAEGSSHKERFEGLIKLVDDLKGTIGIKRSIRDYGIEEKAFLDSLDEMTLQAFDDQCTGANPRYPMMDEIRQMYLNAYYGGAR